MRITPESPIKDENYDLISVLEASLSNAWRMATYIQDAAAAGDEELVEWFSKIQHNSLKAGEQGRRMLAVRLQRSAPGEAGGGLPQITLDPPD